MSGKGAGRAPQRMLIVDGYNIINARRSGGMDSYSLADAREKLLSDLMDYAGYSAQQVVLVFDAWMSDRTVRTEERHGGVGLERVVQFDLVAMRVGKRQREGGRGQAEAEN